MAVEVEVKSQLSKIVEDLQSITKAAKSVSEAIKKGTGDVGEEVDKQNKRVQGGLEKMATTGRKIADRMRQDFLSLGTIMAAQGGFALGKQLEKAAAGAITASDAIHRYGGILGIAKSNFVDFESQAVSSLGHIGLSADVLAQTMKGLSETTVRGSAMTQMYAENAGELASITGERGNESSIAKSIAGAIVAQGGNANDPKQVAAMVAQVLQISRTSGGTASGNAESLRNLYTGTNQAFQGFLRNGGATTLAAAEKSAPGSSAFFEDYLGKNQFMNARADAQGIGNILGANGQINASQVQSIMAQATATGGGKAQAGLEMQFGMTQDQAQAFMRLSEALKTTGNEINTAKSQIFNLNTEFATTKTLMDNLTGSFENFWSKLIPVTAALTEGASRVLGNASQSAAGSAIVTGASAVGAAGGVGSGISLVTGGGVAGGVATSAITLPLTAGIMAMLYNAAKGLAVPASIPGIGSSSLATPLQTKVVHEVELKSKDLKITQKGSRGY
jgi:hypothetical protein